MWNVVWNLASAGIATCRVGPAKILENFLGIFLERYTSYPTQAAGCAMLPLRQRRPVPRRPHDFRGYFEGDAWKLWRCAATP